MFVEDDYGAVVEKQALFARLSDTIIEADAEDLVRRMNHYYDDTVAYFLSVKNYEPRLDNAFEDIYSLCNDKEDAGQFPDDEED